MNISTCNMSKERTEPLLNAFFFLSTLVWVSLKKATFWTKLRKYFFCQRLRLQNDDQNIDRVDCFHQHPQSLRSPISLPDFSFGNMRQFWFICCLKRWMIACFCFFFAVFWTRDSMHFQKTCNSATYLITVKTRQAGKFHQWQESVVS